MEFPKLTTSIRKRSGKGPARRLRQKGVVPAVLYGQGVETLPLTLNPSQLTKILSGPLRTNTIMSLEIEGQKEGCNAIVKDHQFDPVSRQLLHVDLYAVKLDQKIKVKVPLVVTGRSAGEQLGGTMSKLYRSLPIECMPENIPAAIEADVTSLGLNDVLSAGSITMPENTSLLLAEKTPIVCIEAKRVEETKEEGEEGEEAAAEAAPASDAENKSE